MSLHEYRVDMLISMEVTAINALKYARWCHWMARTEFRIRDDKSRQAKRLLIN